MGGAFVASLGVGVPWADAFVSRAVKDPDLVPQAVAVFVVLWTLAAGLLVFLGFSVLPRLVRTLPATVLWGLGVVGCVVPIVCSLWEPVSILGKDLPLRPAYLMAIAL